MVLALISALQDEDDDEALSKLYPRLKFLHIDQMNDFLLQLTELLLANNVTPIGRISPVSRANPESSHTRSPRPHSL